MGGHRLRFGVTHLMATHAINAQGTTGTLRWSRRARVVHALPLALRIVLRRVRSLIAVTIGVSVALAMAMLLIAMSRAIFALMLEDYEVAGTDLYVIERGAMFLPLLPGDSPGEIGDARAALATIRNLPGVGEAVGVTTWQLERGVDGPRGDVPAPLVAVVGVAGDAERVSQMVLLSQGRWFRRENEIVVGPKLIKDLHLAIGDPIILGGRRFTVVGIGRMRGVGLGSFTPGFTFISYDALAALAPIRNAVTSILVDAADPDRTAGEIEARVDRVEVSNRAAIRALMVKLAEHDITFMWGVSALSVIVAGVFVSSLLGRSVEERKAELAVLRAVGISTRTLVGLVIVEALCIMAIAAPIGIFLGHLMGTAANAAYADFLDASTAIYRADPVFFGGVLLLAIVMALLASALPARRIARLMPAEALREV